jgi:hypothetical protein
MLRPNAKEPRHLAELVERLQTTIGTTYRIENSAAGG